MTKELELPVTYTGRVKNTNKKAKYTIDESRGTCNRVSPISFEYLLPSGEDLREEVMMGNLIILDKYLKKRKLEVDVNKVLMTLKVGNLLFSSTEEGIAVIDKTTMEREELTTFAMIEEYVEGWISRRQEIASVRRDKIKVISPKRSYVRERELLERYKHLLAK